MAPFESKIIRGVILDLDQTIIDSFQAFKEAFNAGIRPYGLGPVTEETLAKLLDEGLRMGEMLLALFPTAFNDDGNREACELKIRKAYFMLEPEKVVLKPGVKQSHSTFLTTL